MSEEHIAQISAKSVTPEGEKWIRVIATDPTLDRDGEIIDTASLRVPIKPKGWKYGSDLTPEDPIDVPFLLDHKWEIEKQLGSVRSMFINAEGGLETVAGFTSLDRGKDAHTLAKEGHLGNSFSGTFDYANSYVVDGVIYDAEIVELSMVFKGANRDARVLEVSKAIKKGKEMPELTLEEKKAQAEQLLKEVAQAEGGSPENPEETPVEKPSEPEPAKTVKPKQEKPVQQDIAIKQVKDPPKQEVVEKKESKMSKNDQRKLFVKQFQALQSRDYATLAKLNEKAYEADTSEDRDLKKKAITFSDASGLFQTEVISTDILQEYTNVGRVGQLVSRKDITGAETWKQIIQAAGNGFQPVGAEEVKQEDKPTWSHLSIEPKEHALIVAWYDGMAKRTPLAVYQSIIQYIAREYAKLEDKIIISFAGVTTNGGDVFAPTGLFPILQSDGTRTVNVADFTAAKIQDGLGRAYGHIESDNTLTLVTNRQTWGMLAVTVDTQGRNVFTVVGDQISAGALGTFNVRISQEVPNGIVIMGDMSDYELVTIGGLETLFSQEATVGSLNLFTSDASALRAACDIAGKPVRNKSFVLIDFVPAVS